MTFRLPRFVLGRWWMQEDLIKGLSTPVWCTFVIRTARGSAVLMRFRLESAPSIEVGNSRRQ